MNNRWKSLKDRVSTPQTDTSVIINPLEATQEAVNAMRAYGLRVPPQMSYVSMTTLESIKNSGASVSQIGLGMFHVESEVSDPWIALPISDEEWDRLDETLEDEDD